MDAISRGLLLRHLSKKILSAAWLFLIPGSVQAAEVIGEVVFVKGDASVLRLDTPKSNPLAFGEAIYPMDTLQTGTGELKILFHDKTMLSLGASSKVLLTEYVYNPKKSERRSILDILKGTVRTIVDQPTAALKINDVRLQTPTAVAGIRGTDVGIHVAANGASSQISCFSGLIETYLKSNPEQRLMVQAGNSIDIRGATLPPSPTAIPESVTKQFSSQVQGPPLRDVLNQSGGGFRESERQTPPPPPPPPPPNQRSSSQSPPPPPQRLEARDPEPDSPPPPQEGQEGPDTFDPQSNPESGPPPPPPPPPIVPGGEDSTPNELGPDSGDTTSDGGTTTGGTTSSPIDVPISFPSPPETISGGTTGGGTSSTPPVINVPVSFPGGTNT